MGAEEILGEAPTAPASQRSRAKLGAERRASLGGRDDDDGSLDLEHSDLLNEHI